MTGEITVGQPAPEFTLSATSGVTVSLADYRGAFYPKDFTSG